MSTLGFYTQHPTSALYVIAFAVVAAPIVGLLWILTVRAISNIRLNIDQHVRRLLFILRNTLVLIGISPFLGLLILAVHTMVLAGLNHYRNAIYEVGFDRGYEYERMLFKGESAERGDTVVFRAQHSELRWPWQAPEYSCFGEDPSVMENVTRKWNETWEAIDECWFPDKPDRRGYIDGRRKYFMEYRAAWGKAYMERYYREQGGAPE